MFRKLILAGALALGVTAATSGTASAQYIVHHGGYRTVPVYSPPRVIVSTGWGSPVWGGGWGAPVYGWGGGWGRPVYGGGWGSPVWGGGWGYPVGWGGGWGRPTVGFNFIFR